MTSQVVATCRRVFGCPDILCAICIGVLAMDRSVFGLQRHDAGFDFRYAVRAAAMRYHLC